MTPRFIPLLAGVLVLQIVLIVALNRGGDSLAALKTSTTLVPQAQQAALKREMEPSRLGKALSDTITRRVIIGVLLMLMVLPILTYSPTDYSSEYGLQHLFWFGRSNCHLIQGDFKCERNNWITQ